MMTLTRTVLMSALVMSFAGCFSSGQREPQRYYVLEDFDPGIASARSVRTSTLLIAPATASSFYETQEIAYSRAPGLRGYYQFHSWTERPSLRISELLIARMGRSGSFEAIAEVTSGVQGKLLLSTHLLEFYHDAATSPGSARVLLTAELADPVRRVIMARRTFSRTEPAATYDAPGAVQAFSKATAAILDDIAAWIDDVAPR